MGWGGDFLGIIVIISQVIIWGNIYGKHLGNIAHGLH